MLNLAANALTIGNAVWGPLTRAAAFPGSPLLSRTTAGRFALTMGIANLPAGLFGRCSDVS